MKAQEKKTILYIDDEPDNLMVLKAAFRHEYNVITAESVRQGLYYLREASIDLIISDHRMPEKTGLEFLSDMATEFPEISRILLTAFQEPQLIISSVNKARIFAYVTKPWKKEDLAQLIQAGIQATELKRQNRELVEHLSRSNMDLQKANLEISALKKRVEDENRYLRAEIASEKGTIEMVGTGRLMQEVRQRIDQVASVHTTVLILGETGTGKELVAREIHKRSHRSEKPFIKLNCASLPATLVESELFGYEKGAFTGALQSKPGLFEIAHEGSIFLDEVGELPLELQPKLLRVLQEGEFYKVGGTSVVKVNVRIIAATNRNLFKEIEKGTFRADLFYRLNIYPIVVPPLRERKEDIPQLATTLIEKLSRKLGLPPVQINHAALTELGNHPWPGNIRELEAVLERSLITSLGGPFRITDIGAQAVQQSVGEQFPLIPLMDLEKKFIEFVLRRCDGKISGKGGAAEVLQVNHNTLRSKMVKLKIISS